MPAWLIFLAGAGILFAVWRLRADRPVITTRWRGAVLVALAGLAIILLAWGGRATAGPGPGEALAQEWPDPITEAVLALQPIRRGGAFTSTNLGYRSWPTADLPPGAVLDLADAHNRFASRDIGAGEVLARSMLADLTAWEFPQPLVAGEQLYASRNDGYLYALAVETGREVWRFKGVGPVLSTPAVASGLVYVLDGYGNLYALEVETGREKWRVEGQAVALTLELSPPIVIDGVVYFENSSDGFFYAFEAVSGREKWRLQAPGRATLAGGLVCFTSQQGNVVEVVELSTGQPVLTSSGQTGLEGR